MEGKIEETELEKRQESVLTCVIETYMRTGREVGSVMVSKIGDVKLSPASIRNIMSELEKKGYLNHLHTSGGRVPTLKGLKYYTNSVLKNIRPSQEERTFIKKMLTPFREDVRQMLSETPRVLSMISNYLSVALIPDFEKTPLIRIEIVKLSRTRAIAILVAESGYITYLPIRIKESLTQKELDDIAFYFNSKFSGMSISKTKKLLIEEMIKESLLAGQILNKNILDSESSEEDRANDIIMEGQSNILFHSDFTNIEKLKKLIRALNEKTLLIQLLDEVIKSGQLLILFGPEYDIEGLADCAIVAAPYSSPKVPPGTIGIIGPLRMDYARTVPLIKYTSDLISEWLM